MLIGVFLLLIVALMLLDNLGLIHYRFGEFILPIALIAFGASMIAEKSRKNRS